jgi:hypothetical protein
MSRRRRYAIVGTGLARRPVRSTRSAARTGTRPSCVGLLRPEPDAHGLAQPAARGRGNGPPRPTYPADAFDRMIADTGTRHGHRHHGGRHSPPVHREAMELGRDVITEKPMTTDALKLRGDLRRHRAHRTLAPRRPSTTATRRPYTAFRRLMLDGRGGAAALRRLLLAPGHAARRRTTSGGGTASGSSRAGSSCTRPRTTFDLVNWWIDAYPRDVVRAGRSSASTARANADGAGESYPYARYTGTRRPGTIPSPCSWTGARRSRGPLSRGRGRERVRPGPERSSGSRSRIDDTLDGDGALPERRLCSPTAWSPTPPGRVLRVAVTGDRGRLEMDIVENVTHLMQDAERARASKGAFKGGDHRAPHVRRAVRVEVPPGRRRPRRGRSRTCWSSSSRRLRPRTPTTAPRPTWTARPRCLVGFAANESIRTERLVPHRRPVPGSPSGGRRGRRAGEGLLTRAARNDRVSVKSVVPEHPRTP